MTKSYITHLGTICFVHALVLMGTWHLSQSEMVKAKIGSGVMKLQVATSMMLNQNVMQKKVERTLPVNPLKPRTEPNVQEAKPVIAESVPVKTGGSEVGTSANGTTDVIAVYKAELRATIDKNKYYPTMSRRLGQTGTVVIAFTLLEDGNIVNVRIDKPSQYERLNVSALDAVKKVERFKPIPKEIGENKMDIKVPVKFVTI